jgi:lipoate-protein ligase B
MPEDYILNVARLGLIDFAAAHDLQQTLVRARLENRTADTLLLLEHPRVYTLGRGATESFLIDPPAAVPIYRISRGGQVTYHGPGQLVGYPILKLEGSERDVIRYLRKLEQVILDALAAAGVAGERRAGLTGVWIGGEKIGSIGVGVRRWTTFHGFAVNVATELEFFGRIVPCGIVGCRMTSLVAQGRPEISLPIFGGLIEESFTRVFGYRTAVQMDAVSLGRTLEPVDHDDARSVPV